MTVPRIAVEGLRVELASGADIVDGVEFAIGAGEVLGIVGESGSGKTTVGTALLGHRRSGSRIAHGRVLLGGSDLLSLAPGKLREFRGNRIAYVAQDPGAALNPALRISTQLREALKVHGAGGSEVDEAIARILVDVKLPSDPAFLRRFPHELSGGQQQRVCIAMAFILEPDVVVLDEPTTGLDVTTQAHVLATVRRLCSEHEVAAVYITHDLAVVSEIADRVMVMYAGRIVEFGPREAVFGRPRHPYTRRLLRASPDLQARRPLEIIPGSAPAPGLRPPGCSFHPRCELARPECAEAEPALYAVGAEHRAACLRLGETSGESELAASVPDLVGADPPTPLLALREVGFAYGERSVLRSVSLELGERECVAIVGESGSGKTTLARIVTGLLGAASGKVEFDGAAVPPRLRKRGGDLKREIQYVFQNPYASLNPRKSIGEILMRPAALFRAERGAAARAVIERALEEVALSPTLLSAYPADLSGGERQRIAIARALVAEPRLLICDEVTSALDVSAQASIVDLLRRLVDDRGLAILFVTHDLALVRSLADRCAVLEKGEIVEAGRTATVIDHPRSAYTTALIADTPLVENLGGRG